MSDHAEKEKPEVAQAPSGINAALRYSEPTSSSGGSSGGGGESARGTRREGPYVTRAVQQKGEAERPAEPTRSSAAGLYRAHEAAYDPSAAGDGFVGPASFGLGVYGGAPLQPASTRGGDPNKIPAGGRVSWTQRGQGRGVEVGPPPAHPLSVASPLGIGVAGGAWTAPEPGGAVQRSEDKDDGKDAGEAPVQAKAEAAKPAAATPPTPQAQRAPQGAGAAIGAAWQGVWA